MLEYAQMDRAEEQKLINKAKKGDINAFGLLYENHLKSIYRYLHFKIKNHLDAEDLTETVFVKAWEHLKSFKFNLSFKAWLFKIAHNLLVDFVRKKKQVSIFDIEEPGYLSDAEEKFYLKQEAKRIYEAIVKIPEEYQQVVILRYLEEWDYQEIAKAMGKKEGNIRVMLSRALKLLKEKLT